MSPPIVLDIGPGGPTLIGMRRDDPSLAAQLDRELADRAAQARLVSERAAQVRSRAHARSLRRRRRVHLAPHGAGERLTITAATEWLVVLRIASIGAALIAIVYVLVVPNVPSWQVAAALGGFPLQVAVVWYPWPFRIQLEDRAYAIVDWHGKPRHVGPVTELYFRLTSDSVLDLSVGRRIDFHGVRHPDDRRTCNELQRRYDAIRDLER